MRPKYVARIGERIELADIRKGYIPDVMIVQPPRNPARSVSQGGVLVADEPLTFRFFNRKKRRVPYRNHLPRNRRCRDGDRGAAARKQNE